MNPAPLNPIPALVALALRIEAALAPQVSVTLRDDIPPETPADRRWIGDQYRELKREMGFMEAETRAKREWAEGVLGEVMQPTSTGTPDRECRTAS